MVKSPMPTRSADRYSYAAPLPPVCLPAFEGPLDLLLHLVRMGRMDIFDLPIAALCDQFIAHLNALESRDLGVVGEFLVMAATLVEIKSRMLLPAPPAEPKEPSDADEGDADPRALLVRQLLEYGQYQTMGDTLQERETLRRGLFFRDSPLAPELMPISSSRFGEQSAQDLWRTLQRILATVGADERAVTVVRKQKLTLRLTMRAILTRLRAHPHPLTVTELLPTPPFVLFEAILLFLALLELMKTGDVSVTQDDFCGELYVVALPDAEQRNAK